MIKKVDGLRILHTADWHLGKMFYGEYLTEEQANVLEHQLLPMIREEKIDAVVLAGDVYDRSLPPTEAVELFDEIATKITVELGVPLFCISGNHDSAARLSFGSRLLAPQHLYIAGDLDKLAGPVLLEDAWGTVAFVAAPFAEPAAVRVAAGDDSIRSHQAALERVLQLQSAGVTSQMRTICLAHAFVTGGVASESERPLSIGGTDQVDASVFNDFSYTALGHLHGPQQAGNDHTRYSGSLLKYSFGEANQKKGVVVVELDKAGVSDTSFLPLIPHRDVRVIEDAFDTIMNTDDPHADDYILARLTDADPILDGMAKIRRRYPHAMALETPNRRISNTAGKRKLDLHHTTDQQLFSSFVEEMRPDQELSAAEKQCVETIWQALEEEEGDLS